MITSTPSPAIRSIAAKALDGLEPVVVVNRRVDSAISSLDRAPDATFDTIHTTPRPGMLNDVMRLARRVQEQSRDTYGAGDLAGKTVYGSVRFVPTSDVEAGASSVLDTLQGQGDVGVRAYGPISFVVDPRRADARTTFAPADTGDISEHGVRAFDESHIADVVAERITRGAAGLPRSRELLRLPTAAATDTVRGWLLSDRLAQPGKYIEAHVRGLTPSDLLGSVAVTSADPVKRIASINPGALPEPTQLQSLEQLTQRLGIALRHVD